MDRVSQTTPVRTDKPAADARHTVVSKSKQRGSAIDSIRITIDLGELFTKPDRNSRSLGYAVRNTMLPLYSAREGFYETEYEGQAGWIWQGQAERLSERRVASIAASGQAGDSVRIWTATDILSAPGEGGAFISTAREGRMLPVIVRQGEWIAVEYLGTQAWVRASACVKPVESSISPPLPRSTGRVDGNQPGNKNNAVRTPVAPAAPAAGKRAAAGADSAAEPPVAPRDERMYTPREVKKAAVVSRASPARRDDSVWLILACCIGAAGAGCVVWFVLHMKRQRNLHKAPSATALRARRKCLVVSKKVKYVQSYLLDMPTTLRHCFEEIGFRVFTTATLEEARTLSASEFFEIVLVDWRLCRNGLASAAQLLTSYGSRASGNHVVVYNVPNLDRIDESRTSGVYVLGVILSDRDVFSMVTSRILNSKSVQHAQGMQSAAHAIDGEIQHTPPSETFQFMEMSKKTGCLLMENDGPFGMAYFVRGRIVFASTPHTSGEDALFEILDMKQGKFHFINNKTVETTNCNCAVLALLMEWAYLKDEAAHKNA